MFMRKLAVNYLVFIIGLYFLAAGIVLILRSSLGTTPHFECELRVEPPYAVDAGRLDLSGEPAAHCRAVLVRARPHELPFSFLFGFFIDLNMALTGGLQPQSYFMAIVFLLCGCLIQSVGVVLEIKPRVAMMSAEGFVNFGSQRYGKDFGRFKVAFDVSLVTIAAVLSLVLARQVEGVRGGTVIAALITGYIVNFLNRRVITRAMLRRVLPRRAEAAR